MTIRFNVSASGTMAERPVASSVVGLMYMDTDTKIVYCSDGISWSVAGSLDRLDDVTITNSISGDVLIYNSETQIWENSALLRNLNVIVANKENTLGNPSANGYVLSSNITGGRSWVESASDLSNYTTLGVTSAISSGLISYSQATSANAYTQSNVVTYAASANALSQATSLITVKEPILGNPTSNGQVLTSDTSGGRSWTPQISTLSFSQSAPVDGTIYLDAGAAFPYTINKIKAAATTSGSASVAIKINGTSVTGLSNVSVSNVSADTSASALNTVSIGDQVTLVISSASTPVDMRFTLQVTRT
jgi:hypothetical protein